MSSVVRPVALLTTLAAGALLAGCGATGGAGSSSDEDRLAVASFYPLMWTTEQVAGAGWQVTNLTQPGTEPHDLSLSLPQTAEVGAADFVVIERGFQPAVDTTVENDAEGAVLDVADALDLGSDPHFWQDPLLMADLGDAIAARLGDLDPDGADTYEANAEELRQKLEALDRDFTDGLATCERDHVVVSHAAFGYLSRYGLHFEAISGLSPDAEPTAADLARLQELVRSEGITTVFSERLVSAKAADSLATDTGTGVAVLDPIEGLSDQTADEDYVSLMEANLAALRKASGCR